MSKIAFPDWFINELVNENDKEKALNGNLSANCIVILKCKNNHIYSKKVCQRIKITTKQSNKGCPLCNKERLKLSKDCYANIRTYPDWFISEIANEEDKE